MKKRVLAALTAVFLLVCLSTAVLAAEDTAQYIFDEAGLLTGSEWEELEAMAQTAAQSYGCGLYILVVEDMGSYGYSDIFDFAADYYLEHELGVGADQNGMILALSMRERDYALAVYGDEAKAVFTDSVLMYVEDAFLPDLGKDDWYGGFYSYLLEARGRLTIGPEGSGVTAQSRPVSSSSQRQRGGSFFVCVILPFGISGLICGVLLAQMNSARKKTAAGEYVLSGGVEIRTREDRYLHTTHTRRRVQSSSSGGSHSRSGGGFSGRSGKF